MTSPSSSVRLDALTSLRFFAAAAIAYNHMHPLFGMSVGAFNFGRAVSFFFVLSGFILTWVHPSLENGVEARRFLVARFARIWPAHLVTLLLMFVLFNSKQRYLSDTAEWWMLPANLLLAHAWIPYKACCYHYNAPSWSISTEAFFYLAFPWLISGLRRTWWIKLLLAAALTLGVITMCNVLSIPDGVEPLMHGVSAHVLIYNFPPARLFEFVLGMCAALLFSFLRPRVKLGNCAGTFMEISAVCLVVTLMYYSGGIASATQARFPSVGEPGVLWLDEGGICAPIFGLLIVVMALNAGVISRALSWPFLVLLGEISYSIYLLHWMLIRYYLFHKQSMEWIPLWLRFVLLWAIFLFGSYMLWKYFEKPCRKMIRSWSGKQKRDLGQAVPPPFSWRVFAIEAGVLLVLLLPAILSVHPIRR